jgi:deoxyribodipyrimidine photo-lyase
MEPGEPDPARQEYRSMHTLTHLLTLSRDECIARIAEFMPSRPPGDSIAAARGLPFRGGRAAALERLAAIDPVAYARSRNHVGGAVTRLSPWLRHGVLSLTEVRDAAVRRVSRPEDAEKLITELGWRDYWRQVQAALGTRIRHDIEPPAASPRKAVPLDHVPDDVLDASTGMPCIDSFVRRLHDGGWLHNHERMWLASWLVHVRGVHWLAGADWFLSHLVDGDPASNHLSWQWVAGTFSAKPYLFNRENLERYTDGVHCRGCLHFGSCAVEGSYEDLAERLFVPAGPPSGRDPLRIRPAPAWRPSEREDGPGRPLVWLGLDGLAASSPAAIGHPDAPRLFVLEREWLTDERPSLKRLVFIFECLADIGGVEVVLASAREAVPAVARRQGCGHVVLARTPCPTMRAAAEAIAREFPVVAVDEPAFCDRSRVTDLGRFSRYWSKVGRSALMATPAGR